MEPLLLLPGTLCDARVWRPVLDRLPSTRATVVPVAGARAMPAFARAFLAEAPPRFALAGFSLGGIAALEIVARAPERVVRLALVSTTARPDPPGNAAVRRALVERARREGPRAVVDDAVFPLSVAAARLSDEALRRLVGDMAEAVGSETFAEQTELAIRREDGRPRLAAIEAPTLVVHGDEDRLCPPDRHEEIARGVRGAARVELAGVGHFAPLEAPDAVAAALGRWLVPG